MPDRLQTWYALGNLVASRPDADPIPSPSGTTLAQRITSATYFGRFLTLLVPKLTDIRPPGLSSGTNVWGDLVEVPAGSSRWYMVIQVDDVGKGFPNEHRFAYLLPLFNSTMIGLVQNAGAPNPWPVPIP